MQARALSNTVAQPMLLLGLVGVATLWSVIRPHDYFTWFLETFPVFIIGGILIATYKHFKLTGMLYVLIAIHAVILLIGGHYTYAEVPAFNWLRDEYHLSRNYYDRVGHVAQGFVPALVIRELLIRTSPLNPGKWLSAVIVFTCLGISASYELIEWIVAVTTGEAADAFLGTQGDPWDTQEDMFCALVGAAAALLLLGRTHDRLLAAIGQK